MEIFAGNLSRDFTLKRTKTGFREVFCLESRPGTPVLSRQTDVCWSFGMQDMWELWPQKTSLLNYSLENVDGS